VSLHKSKGIVLSSKVVQDIDCLLTVLLTDGNKSKFRIKGIKKSKTRPIPASEIGSIISFEYYKHELDLVHNIKEINIIERFDRIKSNYIGYLLLSYILEILDLVIPESDIKLIEYNLVEKALYTLEKEKIYFYYLPFFKVKLFYELGLLSKEILCTNCGVELNPSAKFQILVNNLNVICSNCKPIQKDETVLLKWVLFFLNSRYINIEEKRPPIELMFELDRILNDFLRNYMNRELKSFDILYKSIGGKDEIFS
jgi:DNA repair protein RecO (recombination protein O)